MGHTERLIECYLQASPSVRRRGRSWYPQARRLCLYMANEHDRPLSQVAAVLAITSIDAQIVTNVRWTDEVLRGERKAGRYPTKQAPRIELALSTRYPGRFVNGPKCSAFYRAIMGDTNALVLDRWAARAAGYDQSHKRRDLNKTVRRELEAAYREAARICGETVRAFQAIVWIVARESTSKRLADITTGNPQ